MRKAAMVVLVLVLAFAPVGLFADSSGTVGLGLSMGLALPFGSTANIPSTDGVPSFNWGFYVDIPLISTFHITPSSELYQFQNTNATDVDLAFKFIVPISTFDIYAGLEPGLTAVGPVLDAHVGLVGGASLRLVSNLDAFAQAKYTVVFDGNANVQVFHINAGILFAF